MTQEMIKYKLTQTIVLKRRIIHLEMLESLAKLMLQTPIRYEQAKKRELEYDTRKAIENGLSLEQYYQEKRQNKIRHMVEDCVFEKKDDIVLFADCWDAFQIHPDVPSRRSQASSGYGHNHEFFELFYVLKGYCYHYINGQETILHEGSICLLNLQAIHERILPDANSILLTMCIRKSVFSISFLNMLRTIPVFWNFFNASVNKADHPARYIHLQDTPNRELEIILYQMLRTYLLEDEISHSVVKCYLIPLLTEMARIHKFEELYPRLSIESKNPALEAVLETIRSTSGMITLQELADQYHFSLNYLSRLIRETTGKTFKQLSSYYWIEHAKSLLLCTSLGIEDIANLMGFSSRANFERRFKSLLMISPAQFRQSNQIQIS